MNAIAMIRRCGRYGTPEGWAEPVPYEALPECPVVPEEPMGNGETLSGDPLIATDA